ncbi:uncharacterized protein EV420DRAFT_1584758 [Desarmillaria tabescens]|uniref:Uncharacterized protein n=1 Tax=Armillaria tabescens TaxID=1929756 RepID=A0AA39JC38_ARMTA|nr:uncharacterized protein EV420DRAFT_1584758 [Desarmillaria tabescens]KAK0439076.1 hypothetical protein EV420DRAFT_1584758 [Desarmillaria tabescens]
MCLFPLCCWGSSVFALWFPVKDIRLYYIPLVFLVRARGLFTIASDIQATQMGPCFKRRKASRQRACWIHICTKRIFFCVDYALSVASRTSRSIIHNVT